MNMHNVIIVNFRACLGYVILIMKWIQ